MHERPAPVPGRTWEVRPTLLTTETEVAITDAEVDKGLRIRERLRARGIHDAGFGLVHGPGGVVAVTATLVVDAPTPGQAVDTALTSLLAALDAEGGVTNGLQELVVVPGWVDERDWRTAR